MGGMRVRCARMSQSEEKLVTCVARPPSEVLAKCALIGSHWRLAPRNASIVISDRDAGYMIGPASAEVRARLVTATITCRASVDVDRDQVGNSEAARLTDKAWVC
ncbi:hypothetical protein MTDSW087_04016 [Methylobacterium dankookense]|uniref:Uncharacterized protein n=1 Tax=Methylobacterium dankookense TaxID=560405 RepID=A0A564G2X3_9HYPH|nr:hypothetical protein IFDJLNFL_1400 [Methylobacterium dankookense]VUF14298.1 hypothetical protein MTDSW087_04016 [Methylobacterium dankookense]